MKPMASLVSTVISLTIAVDTADVNVFVLAGSPGSAVEVVITINTGVTVYQSAGFAALRIQSFITGSKVKVINRGSIVGKGGVGGTGGTGVVNSGMSGGNSGGDAILTSLANTEIDNTTGNIFGAGGGGGGGRGGDFSGGVGSSGGGGGGGGQGRNDGTGGAGGTDASPGGTGTFSSAGTGGAHSTGFGSDGGNGGGWGAAGNSGQSNLYGSGAAGGNPGNAVRLTGAGSVVWLGGSSYPQVRGAVSA